MLCPWPRPHVSRSPLQAGPTSRPTHFPSLPKAHGGSLATHLQAHSTVDILASLPSLPPHSGRPSARSPPQGKQLSSLSSWGLSYPVVCTGAASAVGAVAERMPPPEFCGLKIWLCLGLVCFVLTFGIFPRSLGCEVAHAHTHAPAVHSGAWRSGPHAPPTATRENSDESRTLGGGAGACLWLHRRLLSFNSAASVLESWAIHCPAVRPAEKKPGFLIGLVSNYFNILLTVRGR